MSDGPYRSLPMSREWKRLAKFAENASFVEVDVCEAASHALATTWRNEVPDAVVNGIKDVFLDREPGLFVDAHAERMEAVAAEAAGYGLGRQFAAHAWAVVTEGITGAAGLVEATKRTLASYAARAVRQIEEHYCRKSLAKLTQQVRDRIALAVTTADFDTLARQCSGLEPRGGRRSTAPKHVGIDDGVPLP